MTRRLLLLTWALASAIPAIAWSQPATGPSGHWEGSIAVPGQEMAIIVDLASKDGAWVGTIAIPAQNLKGFPLSDITVAGSAVGFSMKGVPGGPHFAGTLSADGKSLSGQFEQGGGTTSFTLAWKGEAVIEEPPKSTEITKDLEGNWEGGLVVQGTTMRLVLKLANHAGGATGVMVSIDQGDAEIPLTSITQAGSEVKFTITTINAGYAGELKDGQLTGTWSQGPGSWPLAFKRPAK